MPWFVRRQPGLVETRALLADSERLLAESADHLRSAWAAYDRTELLIARAQGQIRACEALLARTHRQLQTVRGRFWEHRDE